MILTASVLLCMKNTFAFSRVSNFQNLVQTLPSPMFGPPAVVLPTNFCFLGTTLISDLMSWAQFIHENSEIKNIRIVLFILVVFHSLW